MVLARWGRLPARLWIFESGGADMVADPAGRAYRLRGFPYQSFSAYAGNPYLIDLDLLREDGLLTQAEIDSAFWGADPARVDYGALYQNRLAVLSIACHRGWERDAEAVAQFSAENRNWLPDYALFMALKQHFGGKPWMRWPKDIRLRRREAVERYRKALSEDVALFTYLQFLFFRQWDALRAYAAEQGFGLSAICRFMWPWTPPMCGRSLKISSWTRS